MNIQFLDHFECSPDCASIYLSLCSDFYEFRAVPIKNV